MTFHQIKIGERFRKKEEFCYFPYLKSAVWERIEPGTPMGKNAIYVEGEYTGMKVMFEDNPKLKDDYYDLA